MISPIFDWQIIFRLKQTIILLLTLFCCLPAMARGIDMQTAKYATMQLFIAHGSAADSSHLSAVSWYEDETNKYPAFYVVTNSMGGFAIVSATDQVQPIFAYSDEANFQLSNISPEVKNWMKHYAAAIKYVRQHNIEQAGAKSAWAQLLDGQNTFIAGKTTIVKPLLTTTWNQSTPYNNLCPLDVAANRRTYTGCVATVLAQIMKYWSWPVRGIGNHTYRDSTFGTLHADFSRTNYQWSKMPNNVVSANAWVDTLMYQAGVAVNMSYGVISSSSYVLEYQCPIRNNAQFALVNYFCYNPGIMGFSRTNFSDEQWLQMLENELNAGRPVIYNGANDTEGHSFIADGYDANGNIHFNWGWGGAYNGYYSIGNIAPDSINFMQDNSILTGIQPDTTRSLVMADAISVPDSVFGEKPFKVSASVINVNKKKFDGTVFGVLLNDNAPYSADTIALSNETIASGDSLSMVFSFDGLIAGNYHLYLHYSDLNSEFASVDSTADYQSIAPLYIAGGTQRSFYVFPNPAQDYFAISLNNTSALAYKICDASGRLILQGSLNDAAAVIPVNSAALLPGIYFVTLSTPYGILAGKVSVNH